MNTNNLHFAMVKELLNVLRKGESAVSINVYHKDHPSSLSSHVLLHEYSPKKASPTDFLMPINK
jgi:hypothetical protein